MAKVAVVSTDGLVINEHFGRANEFLIYDVSGSGSHTLLETRQMIQSPADSHDQEVAAKAELLADVEVVLVAQIGPGAEKALRQRGIIALTITGAIEKALVAYGKRGKFIRTGILNVPVSGCSGGHGSCSGGPGSCH
jgi:nitrogen fixation protein NifB